MRTAIPQGELCFSILVCKAPCFTHVQAESYFLLTLADVDYALANLHSYANGSGGQTSNKWQLLDEKENSLLLDGDLVDDDDGC